MKPLPLYFDGRPVPPAPPPYQAPAAGVAASSPPSLAPALAPPALAPPALAPRVDPGAPPRAPEAALRALLAVYRDVDAEIARLSPRCDARGVCCDFDVVDHVLYASKLEIDLVKEAIPAARHARASGNRCPFLEDGKCGAREVRMLGCRTYFCQPGWEPVGADVYERHYARIQAIAVEFDLDWRYAPALGLMRDGT